MKDGVAFLPSRIAPGVVLEIDGNLVEDAAWLRKKNINVAELDAVLKDINLAQQWEIRRNQLQTQKRSFCG